MSALVVVGDALLDTDVAGTVSRVAPDAPAPVLDETSRTDRPGGAGLAALLAAGQGHDVTLVTALAPDEAGDRLRGLLKEAGIAVHALPLAGGTPEKIRFRAAGQVLLRHDRGGEPGRVGGSLPDAAVEALRDADAILVSDYGRGLTSHAGLRELLATATAPVVWDPHPRGAPPVPGTRLVTPNEKEARHLGGDDGAGGALAVARRTGPGLRERWGAAAVAVTIGAGGAVLSQGGSAPLVVPAPAVTGGDTCGAGDQFAAAAAVALAGGALPSEAVQAAVSAAAAFVGRGGAGSVFADISDMSGNVDALLARVRAAGGTVVATGGCFDILHAGHVSTLQAARGLGDCLIVCLNSDDSVRGLKGPGRPVNSQEDRARLLAALDCVDAVVIFAEPNPERLLDELRPDVWVKGGDYAELPEAALIRSWGGEAVVVPYLDGRSTTSTLRKVGR